MTEYKYKVSDFEGPLDLLLYLIEKNKVDIYNIPIVEITDQFNAYVADIDTFDVDYASKFFVMAATLLQIKSRLLLPKQPKLAEEEEEDPQEALVRQLVEYKKMKALSQAMGQLWDARSLMLGRLPTAMPYEARFAGHIDTEALYQAFHKVCQALPEPTAVEIRIQIFIKIHQIQTRKIRFRPVRRKEILVQVSDILYISCCGLTVFF